MTTEQKIIRAKVGLLELANAWANTAQIAARRWALRQKTGVSNVPKCGQHSGRL